MIFVYFDRESLGNAKAQQALRGVRVAIVKRKRSCEIYHDLPTVPSAPKEGTPILVYCHSESRSTDLFQQLVARSYRPIFIVSPVSGAEGAVSCVAVDYRQACYSLTLRALEGGTSVALLGFNHDSVPDKQRREGFEWAVRQAEADGRVFANTGGVRGCLDAYWPHREAYKNVICVNDIHAVALINRLKDVGEDPGAYRICAFGNTMLSRYSRPRITTVEPNYELAGSLSVELYSVLERNPLLRSVTFTAEAEICEGESMTVLGTGLTELPMTPPAPMDFYTDSYVRELDGLDRMLSGCDETDLGILRGLSEGLSSEVLSERLFIASNTLKYRLKKMMTAAEAATRAELLARIEKYRLHI